MKNVEKLIKSKNWKERLIGARLSPIVQVLQVARTEDDEDVCRAIVQRLEENKDLDIVKESYSELINSYYYLIREFVAKNAKFELVLQMEKTEDNEDICSVIVQRLEENKDLDIVKESYSELAYSKSAVIREFVAKNAKFGLVLQMSKTEYDRDIFRAIVQRLEENKDLDIVKESYSELAYSKSAVIREFVAQNAKFELVLQMVKTEDDINVCKTIVQRLEENKDLDIVKELCSELVNSYYYLIREFVAQNAKFELVLQMAKTEYDRDVCRAIVQRLEENKDRDIVKESYSELAYSKSAVIREFVAQNAKFELVLQMVKTECSNNVCGAIAQRLEENKDLDIVKESYSKLAYSKPAVIRKFVLGSAEFDIVANIINKELKSKNNFYSDEIIELMYHNPNYIKATSNKKIELLGSIELEYLIDVAVYEKDEKVLLWIYKKIK